MSEIRGQLVGAFTGYNPGAVFRLTNGQVWQQCRYKYQYKYKYRPTVRIHQDCGGWLAEFDCMGEPIGNDFPRSNHEASLLVMQTLFGWVSDSKKFKRAVETDAIVTAHQHA